MRIVHVIDNLAPGGTERQCVELVRGLSRLGVRSAVFYFTPGPLLAELDAAAIPVRALEQASVRSVGFPARVAALAREIRRWAPDVVQTYGFHSNVRGLLAAFLSGVPVRIAGRREFAKCLSPGQRRADRWAWRLAHRIVANSEAVRRQLMNDEHVPAAKIMVIRNGLDLQPWLGISGPHDTEADPVVGMVAHFREDKDHLTFLRAAREVHERVPVARFCLVGSGPLQPAMREWAGRLGIADRVEFAGRLEAEALRAAVSRFRISVLASKSEGLPNTVLESMAAGRPVVASAVGGTEELLADEVTGFLVPAEQPAILADRIVRLLKDPGLAERMGERARHTVEREFTADRMARQFGALYRELLVERRGRDR
jgi:glycosyltransferase involved in cell wall biosynthesis